VATYENCMSGNQLAAIVGLREIDISDIRLSWEHDSKRKGDIGGTVNRPSHILKYAEGELARLSYLQPIERPAIQPIFVGERLIASQTHICRRS